MFQSEIGSADPTPYGPGPVLRTLGSEARDMVLDVARGAVFESSGSDFFDGLAHFLYALVGAEVVVVGKISPDCPAIVQTLARYRHGERTPNKRFEIAGTPCGEIAGPQTICVYRARVAQMFPTATGLVNMNAQGFVGMPLFARDGRKIGLLAVITTQPIEDVDTLTQLMLLVGKRASLELEHLLAISRAASEASDLATMMIAAE